MNYYAVTINPNHYEFNLDLKEVCKMFESLSASYIEVVNHNNDHLHALVSFPEKIENIVRYKSFHYSRVRNLKAYQKYMHSHDKVDSLIKGELGYFENSSIVEHIILYGAVSAVQIYGWQALRYYRQLKEFEQDYKALDQNKKLAKGEKGNEY